MTRQLNDAPLSLVAADTPAWRLWQQLARLSQLLEPSDWLLVGGQMVALHCHLAGVTPGRTTVDIDIVANVLVTADALLACRHAARALGLSAQPTLDGRHQHRFRNEEMTLDVLVPDHTPKHLRLTIAGVDAVPIVGGTRALQRAAQCTIRTAIGPTQIPIPDLQGAIVLKARAWAADTRDRDRHLFDLAQLSAAIDDPLAFVESLDGKERRALRKVRVSTDVSQHPWLGLSPRHRANALEAWLTIATTQ